MTMTGGCYCKAVRYEVAGEPRFKGICFCRECQHVSGGNGNIFMLIGADTLKYTKGAPKRFKRADLPGANTREFCGECGTHLTTLLAGDPTGIVLKVGSLDDPSAFGAPQAVLYKSEMQPFHTFPEGVHAFEKFPG
jgi:hypothetical protein